MYINKNNFSSSMKSLTQIICAITLSAALISCNKHPDPPKLTHYSFTSKYGGIIQVDYLEYYKDIRDFEREIVANLHLRPQDAEFSEDYPKIVLDIYSKGNQSVRTFIDYGFSNNSVVVDEYWDGQQFIKRNNQNEEEFKKYDQEYLQILDLIDFRAKVARKIRD